MVVTGTEGNPFYTLCQQLGTELHPLRGECPLFHSCSVVPKGFDSAVEELFNLVLDKAGNIDPRQLKPPDGKMKPLYGVPAARFSGYASPFMPPVTFPGPPPPTNAAVGAASVPAPSPSTTAAAGARSVAQASTPTGPHTVV